MDELDIMTKMTTYLNTIFEGRINFLLHATTFIIHAYSNNGEIARIQLIRGSRGGHFINITNPSRRFDGANVKITKEWMNQMLENLLVIY